MNWNYDLFWDKSQKFIKYTHKFYKDSSLYSLWASFSLEIIARATLSFKHPALLADTIESENILYAFNFPTNKEPKSIPIKTVFERLSKIINNFSKTDVEFCMDLMNKRNIEMHTGENAFENYTTDKWQADYYRIIKILLLYQNKGLNDLLPNNMLATVEEMIKKDYTKIEKIVKGLISLHRNDFYKENTELQQKEKRKKAENEIKKLKEEYLKIDTYYEIRKCPACSSFALVSGNLKTTSEPFIEKDETITQLSILPTKLECKVCELTLNGYDKLQAVKLASNIILTEKYNFEKDKISISNEITDNK